MPIPDEAVFADLPNRLFGGSKFTVLLDTLLAVFKPDLIGFDTNVSASVPTVPAPASAGKPGSALDQHMIQQYLLPLLVRFLDGLDFTVLRFLIQ